MKVTRAFQFEAAHCLPNVSKDHQCRRMHGHTYRVEVTCAGAINAHTGFVVDFFDIDRVLAPIKADLDHRCLNDVPGLGNPTAEAIAIWIYRAASEKLSKLASVRVYENADCWAEYEARRGD